MGIVIDSLTKTYKGGKVKALSGLSLSVNEGEIFGIIGPNGAGKTTLFGCLLSLLKIDAGSIAIQGLPPDSLSYKRLIGYLPERLTFDRWMTGLQFMSYHYELAGQPLNERKSRIEEILRLVALEPTSWSVPIKKYSRGMLQRIGFAQAILGRPKYLLLDEPASGVDPSGVLLFRKLLKQEKAKGTTIVINSHQLDQLEKVCDRVALVKAGTIQAIEDLSSIAATGARLRVTWIKREETEPAEAERRVGNVIASTGAELIEFNAEGAVFLTPTAEVTAATIKALVNNGFPLIRATAEESRLERFFTATDGVPS